MSDQAPSTPQKSHTRRVSSIPSTPATPETAYVLASEHMDTPTRPGAASTRQDLTPERTSLETLEAGQLDLRHTPVDEQHFGGSSAGSGSGSGDSYNSELLEMLENDEDGDELDEAEDGNMSESGEPLVGSGRRRRRRRWEEDEEQKEQSLFELVPPLILAHPLPLLPMLATLPYNFLPAGVVFFIPIICVLTILSSCAHIVIVYLSWYLKVPTFEDVFASVTGRYGRYGQWAGRGAVIVSTLGLLIGWMEISGPLLAPVVETYLPQSLTSTTLWTIVPALALLPSLLPSRMTRSLRRAPVILALLLPVVTFLVIGRTVEIKKASEEGQPPLEEAVALVKRKIGLGGGSSAGAGLTTLAIFLSPHLNTLPIHSSLSRNKRASFPLPCILSSGILLALSLPFALVPYYLLPPSDLPTATPTTSTGVFGRLPADDGWVNLARVLQCIIGLGTSNMWILRCRDSVLGGLGVERGQKMRIGRWVGLGLWVVVVSMACIGGWVAEKVELLGVIATLSVGWLLPSVFFIITFHVRSPLSIVFPSRNPPTDVPTPRRHGRSDSLSDPSADVLLAQKERQLQKRRLGRRLWQDLIVYIGILPVGCICVAWTLGRLLGIW